MPGQYFIFHKNEAFDTMLPFNIDFFLLRGLVGLNLEAEARVRLDNMSQQTVTVLVVHVIIKVSIDLHYLYTKR